MSSTHAAADVTSNLANLLPTGTYLTFQALAPIFTNNSVCGISEKIMTGLLLTTFSLLCWFLCFTDSLTTETGKIYYGVVTCKGLYSPQFATSTIPYRNSSTGTFYQGPPGTSRYYVQVSDFLNGILNVVVFCVLTLLTAPVTTCYYPTIPSTVTKTTPILMAIIVGMYFAFAPPARHGLGFAINSHGMGLVPDHNSSDTDESQYLNSGKREDQFKKVDSSTSPMKPQLKPEETESAQPIPKGKETV